MKKKFSILLSRMGLLIILSGSGDAASSLERDFQSWINITSVGNLNNNGCLNRLRYWLESQQRLGDNSREYTQILLRPGLGYALSNNATIWLGYAWIYTAPPNSPIRFKENRIWQQLLWIQSLPSFTFMSRTRTEQRFLENNYKTAYRFRELVKIFVPFGKQSKFAFVSSDEVFLNKNNFVGTKSRGFDQNRFFVGLGYEVNSTSTVEIGYMNQYICRFGSPDFLSHILSINLYLTPSAILAVF